MMFIVFTSLSAMIKDSIIVTCCHHDLLTMIQCSISVRVMTVAMPYITLYKPEKSALSGFSMSLARMTSGSGCRSAQGSG